MSTSRLLTLGFLFAGTLAAGGCVKETRPVPVLQVKPQYTSEAMRAKIQGVVTLEVVVNADGTVGDANVVRSLDPIFGLDQSAIAAVKAWKFKPGRRAGKPIPVLVTVELSFTLR